MKTVRCAETSGVCSSPITCLSVKKCVQVRAAKAITEGETQAGRT
jgi:hypothetical protein